PEHAYPDVLALVVGPVPPAVLEERERERAQDVDALAEHRPHDLGVVQLLVEVAPEAVVARGLVLEPRARHLGAVELVLDDPPHGRRDDLEVPSAGRLVDALAQDRRAGHPGERLLDPVDAGHGGHLEGTLGERVAREGMAEEGERVGRHADDVSDLCFEGGQWTRFLSDRERKVETDELQS
ncbi:hypothetical protein THAOC_19518, partial [Thalassiosira oceanica]